MHNDTIYAYHDNATRKNDVIYPLPGSYSTILVVRSNAISKKLFLCSQYILANPFLNPLTIEAANKLI